MDYQFPKSARLRKRYQFQRLASRARRCVGSLITIEYFHNQTLNTRLGVTVSRKFGKAHERNRFKRIVREAFRLCRHQLISGQDLNVKPRSNAKKAKMADILNEIVHLLSPK